MPPKLGIIAGGGEIPGLLIENCLSANREFFVIALQGSANLTSLKAVPHASVRIGAAGKIISILHQENVTEIVFTGDTHRPSLCSLRPDLWALKFLLKTRALSYGDDGLLRAIICAMEEEGFSIVGLHDLLPDLLIPEGVLTSAVPGLELTHDLSIGSNAARALGARDLGQAVIIYAGRVIAEEDIRGTDAMLQDVAALGGVAGGILAKFPKPSQDRRIDLPTLGPRTVELAADAGLAGIVVESAGALIVSRDETVNLADQRGLFILAAPTADRNGFHVYMIAGEPSGDLLGGRILAGLNTETGGSVQISGVGGEAMTAHGLRSLFPMSELSVMGVAEILPKVPNLLRRIHDVVGDIKTCRPDVVVTIDSPDFCFRVLKKLKGRDIPLVHLVAPSVWAWRPGRARRVAQLVDRLLTLLPFEPPYFTTEGLDTEFIGHPVLESGADRGDGAVFRKCHGIPSDAPLIVILPGSRMGEVKRHLPILKRAIERLMVTTPDLKVVVPVVPTLTGTVRDAVQTWPISISLIEGNRNKFNAFAAADVALAASGTVAIELAMAGTPTVIAYRFGPVTEWLAKRLRRIRFSSLINLVLDREVMPEFIFDDCRSASLAEAVDKLLRSEELRDSQRRDFSEALTKLGQGHAPPSRRAARAIIELIACR